MFSKRINVSKDVENVKISERNASGNEHVMQPKLYQALTQFGIPSADSIFLYPNFMLSFNRQHRIANWVIEYMVPDEIKMIKFKRFEDILFKSEVKIHKYFRLIGSDFKDSGYDRGHYAAVGNYTYNEEFMKNTFVYTNVAPQVGKGFNRGKWNELEKYVRATAMASEGLWVCTGPLFLPQYDADKKKQFIKYEVMGLKQVAVPTHFFKVILYKQNGSFIMEAFILPNEAIDKETPLNTFRVNPEVIERSSGLLFWRKLNRNDIKVIQ